jgi:hypothetical protein
LENAAGVRGLLVVLALTGACADVVAQQPACVAIRRGDTAALAAARLTGSAATRHAPWFHIIDPVSSAVIAKADYDHIRPGWRACIMQTPAGRVTSGDDERAAALAIGVHSGLPTFVRRIGGAIDPPIVLLGALLLAIALIGHSLDEFVRERQALVATMRRFGGRFVREFERPLIQEPLRPAPIKARLRVRPARRRLEVLLAPAAGRRYPNLTDHRRNAEYDVQRVLRSLGNEPFVSGPLYAQGTWVVVPFQLTRKAGAR